MIEGRQKRYATDFDKHTIPGVMRPLISAMRIHAESLRDDCEPIANAIDRYSAEIEAAHARYIDDLLAIEIGV